MTDEYRYLPFEIDGVRYAVPLNYVVSILLSSEEFPSCVPPKRNTGVVRLMKVNQELITIVEIAAFEKNSVSGMRQDQRPYILSLRYQDSLIGLLVDYVFSLREFSEPRFEKDSVNQRTILMNGTEHFILFDVSELHKALLTA